MRNIILKEKVIEFLNKACIYTATLLVAVLVFIAFGFETPVNAAAPVSSVEKIAKKVKNSDKYYKKNSKSKKPVTDKDTEMRKNQTEPSIGKDTDNTKDIDKDTETGKDTDASNDADKNTDTEKDTTNDNGCDGSDSCTFPDVMWNDKYTEEELRLMSGIIYCEAGSMGESARVAVANVIINRANSKTDWGHVNTIKEVIYDQKWGVQFSPIKGSPSSLDQAMDLYDHIEDYKGTWQYDQMQNSIAAAKKAFSGEKVIPDSFMYFNGSIESSKAKCEAKGKDYIMIDHHIYFE
jgi:spore germination cell wall hydrolase CwlJ-like protein